MNNVMKHLQLQKTKFTPRGEMNMFDSIWQQFIEHYNKNNPMKKSK